MLRSNNSINAYLACGATDLRKSIDGLALIVQMKFQLDPFSNNLFIFCNKNKTSIKILRWDNDGFILLTKKLVEKMKFQWPKDSEGVKNISARELRWLLEGLSIEQPKAHKNININEDICF